MGLTFETWMERVDSVLDERFGLMHLDLPDAPYWDMWDAGYTPGMMVDSVEEGIATW